MDTLSRPQRRCRLCGIAVPLILLCAAWWALGWGGGGAVSSLSNTLEPFIAAVPIYPMDPVEHFLRLGEENQHVPQSLELAMGEGRG